MPTKKLEYWAIQFRNTSSYENINEQYCGDHVILYSSKTRARRDAQAMGFKPSEIEIVEVVVKPKRSKK